MKVETSAKRELLTHWAIANVNELGMEAVCAARKQMMRWPLAAIREFCKNQKEGTR